MSYIKLDPMNYPLLLDENWWVIHPNNGDYELKIPVGAPAVCKLAFPGTGPESKSFKVAVPYRILSMDDHEGWILISAGGNDIYEMPQYVFARHFDIVAFVRPTYKKPPIESDE